MIAKLSAKNQLTLPKSIVLQINKPEYSEVSLEDGRIVLTPVRMQLCSADAVREKLASLGITEQDVDDAVNWGRKGSPL